MSVRNYQGPHSERGRTPSAWARRLPAALAAVTIGLQILWPLTAGEQRATVTVLVVWAFFLASATHAWLHRGWAWTLGWAGVSLAFGLGIEVLGTRTGIPFSGYAYRVDALGWTVAGIPVVIPLAWAMMSYPALLVGRRLAFARRGVVIIGAWALASWDLFLDPQMVGEGYWTWDSPTPAIPGVPGIPIINYLGWLLAALVLMALLSLLPDPDRRPASASFQRRTPEAVPAVLYLWTWVGGMVANLFFLDRPAVAVVGGVAMGLVAVPYALRLTERPV